MKHLISSFFKILIFLVTLFVFQRLVFILFFLSELKHFSLLQLSATFFYGLPMDASTAAGFLLLLTVLLIFKLFVPSLGTERGLNYLMLASIILSWIITAFDIALYESWGTRINAKAISYVAFPGEAIKSTWSTRYLFLFSITVILAYLTWRMFKLIFRHQRLLIQRRTQGILFTCLMPLVLIVVMRGGFQEFPLGKSWVYFSPHAPLNQAALNSVWNFGYALTQPAEPTENAYSFFSESEAKKLVSELHATPSDSQISILKSQRPNILLILMESWGDSVTKQQVNGKMITPNFKAACADGLQLTKFYSPGFRTEQGVAALISGFPSLPVNSIVRKYGVFDRLPGLPKSLSEAGYTSSFYYGGSLHFANTDGYLQAMGFEKMTGDKSFPGSKRTGWGIYDEELFSFFISDMKNTSQPFFSIVLSCTSHEPFDAAVERIVPHEASGWCNDYINTIHYSDRCLGKFLADIRELDWYQNTLVIITGDHGQECSDRTEYNSAERHHVPFLFTGGALKDELRGSVFLQTTSQVDFTATLLSQLGIDSGEYRWSKNIFGYSYPSFAFYSFDDGFGWITDSSQVIFDNKMSKVISINHAITKTLTEPVEVINGKAYLQVLMDEYISFSGK
jgi:phosphoglycerol transferase MdoB-like AlkP superfamily enzyme